MQKAHLVEALCLMNQGTDDAVRGLQRLKKASGLTEEVYGDTLARLEHAHAQVNLQSFQDLAQPNDAAHYERPQRDAGEHS